jgi:hypothetical protein
MSTGLKPASRGQLALDRGARHPGPNLALLAIAFTILKLASIGVVSALTSRPSFPSPSTPPAMLIAYFQDHSALVLWCAFLQFGSAIPLGLFAATVASHLRFLGLKAAGADIAFFGGLLVACDTAASAAAIWALAQPGIAQDPILTRALYSMQFALGGPGFAVPMGLLLAGVSVSGGLANLLPRWIVWLGLALAVSGGLSWLNMLAPASAASLLIPRTRFPAFVWLIAAGLALPAAVKRQGDPPSRQENNNP